MKIWDKSLSVLFSALAFIGNIFSHLQSYIQRVLRENRRVTNGVLDRICG